MTLQVSSQDSDSSAKGGVLLLAKENESYLAVKVKRILAREGIHAAIANTDTSVFINRSRERYYPNGETHYSLESVYERLHSCPLNFSIERLSRFEKRYGYPKGIHNLLMSHKDINPGFRYPMKTKLPSPDVQLTLAELTIDWANEILDLECPNVVISIGRDYFVKNLFYQICRGDRIPFISFIPSRISNLHVGHLGLGQGLDSREHILATDGTSLHEPEPTPADFARARLLVTELKDGGSQGIYPAVAHSLSRRMDRPIGFAADAIKEFTSRMASDISKAGRKKRFRGPMRGNYIDNSSVKKVGWRLRRLTNKLRYALFGRRTFAGEYLSSDRPFVLYFLHAVPEGSTLTLGDEHDEISLIRSIRQSLGVEIQLVVKENPIMVGDRPFSYYRELRALPNLHLVPPSAPNIDLIRKSCGVAGISGSALLEAALLSKPTLCFGYPEFARVLSFFGRRDLRSFSDACSRREEVDPTRALEHLAQIYAAGIPFSRKVHLREPESIRATEEATELSRLVVAWHGASVESAEPES